MGQPRSEQDAAALAGERQLLERTARWTVPGYDVDAHGNHPDAARTARALAAAILAVEARRGVRLRVSWSGGPGRPGLHLDHGPAEPDAARPDLLRVHLRRRGALLAEAGLVPRRAALTSACGVPLQWVLLEHAQHEDPPAFVDLAPVNHDPGTRERLWRSLGGLHHAGGRKVLCTEFGDCSDPSPITAAMNAEAPEPSSTRSGSPERNAVVTPRRPLEPLPPMASGREGGIGRWLTSTRLAGDNHETRLALASVCQQARAIDEEAFALLVGQYWGDEADARAAWRTTALRLASGQRTRGKAWLRDRLGHGLILDLAVALAQAAAPGARPLELVVGRLGLPCATQAEGLREVELELEDRDREELARRVHTARLGCGYVTEACRCSSCAVRRRPDRQIRCHARELCQRCCVAATRAYVAWCRRAWKGERIVSATLTGSLEDVRREQGALRRAVVAGARACAAIYPGQAPGVWHCLLLAQAGTRGASDLRALAGWREVARHEACDQLAEALLRRTAVLLDAAQRGQTAWAADVVEGLYRTRRVLAAGSALQVPTELSLRQEARERAALEQADSGLGCGHEGESIYTYSYRGVEVLASQHPESLAEVVGQAVRYHQADPAAAPAPRSAPLRR